MSAFYLNELLLKLTHRHDPVPAVFDTYHATLESARKPALRSNRRLRIFEKRLLDQLGYGVELDVDARNGTGIAPDAYYHFRPAYGVFPAAEDASGAMLGASLLSLAREQLSTRAGARRCEAPAAGRAGALPGRPRAEYARRRALGGPQECQARP